MNYLLLVVSILPLMSCSSRAPIALGKTTDAQLFRVKGEPVERQTIDDTTKSYVFEGDERYQSDKGVITTVYREPVGEQKKLQYWRAKWKNVATTEKEVTTKAKTDSENLRELSALSLGTAVIFQPNGHVIRVVEFAH